MDEQPPEAKEFEDNTVHKEQLENVTSTPSISLHQHVERIIGGTVIGVYSPRIVQPTAFRPPLQRPPRAEHFIGREKEFAQLLKDLQPGRVVTLCGPGGIGKTALAAEAIWTLAPSDYPPERFPDGIIFHSFYKQPQAALAMEEIAREYGEELRPTPRDAAKRALAGRKSLIVLDGAEDADDLSLVLGVCGGCCVLVTSRSRKDAIAERQDISSLPLNEAEKLLKSWGGERAEPSETVRQICELVGGLPLAVKLVGRYLAEAEVDAEEYLSWLKMTPLKALDQGKRREESVLLLLERSLEKLSDTACQIMGVVGMLALAPFSRDVVGVAQELSHGEQIKSLGELINYGILLRQDQLYVVSHSLIYTFARSQQGADKNVFQRMSEYYLDFIRKNVKAGLDGYTSLDLERLHLMEFLKACIEREEWGLAISLIWTMDDYLDLGGFWIERVNAFKVGLTAARKLEDRRDEAAFFGNLGNSYFSLGQVKRAIEYHEQALTIHKEIGDRRGEGLDLGNLGNAYHARGKVKRAIDYHEQALVIAREIGDRRGKGVDLGNMGLAYFDLGLVKRAIEYYEQALTIHKEIGDRRGVGLNLGNLGLAYSNLGKLDRAIEYYEQAMAIALEIGDRYSEGNHLGNLGNAYRFLGRVKLAIKYHEQSLTIDKEIGNRRGEGVGFGNLGATYHSQGQMERAIEYYEQALAISREISNRYGEAADLAELGGAYRDLGQMDQAIEYYKQALAISREIGDRRWEVGQLGNLGFTYYLQGQVERAIEHYEQALTIAREIGDRRGEGNRLGNLGAAYHSQGQMERAIEYYEQALAISQEIGNRYSEAADLAELGGAFRDMGQVERAIEYCERALTISREIGNRRGEGVDLGNLGNTYRDSGQVERAIEYYEQGLAIVREIGDRRRESNHLGDLGIAYVRRGDLEQAIEYLEKALAISREIGDRGGVGRHSWNLGLVYKQQGELPKAIGSMQNYVDYETEIGHPNAKKHAKRVAELRKRLADQESNQ